MNKATCTICSHRAKDDIYNYELQKVDKKDEDEKIYTCYIGAANPCLGGAASLWLE